MDRDQGPKGIGLKGKDIIMQGKLISCVNSAFILKPVLSGQNL